MDDKLFNLSNFIVKVYRKKDNKISFHLNTHLLFQSENYFNSTDLKKIECSILTNNGLKINFKKIQKTVSEIDYDYSFNGKAKVIEIHMENITEYMDIKNSVVELKMKFQFKEYNYINEKEYLISNYGLLKKMYDERLDI
ncbi:hypothetical protein PJW08_09285 [Tenacibaculum finnmarkense]|nr:hypothetical protein PJW08_09285 [Tenacibaculum finnmarkense]